MINVWKKGDNSSKFCLVSSWEVNNLQMVALRQKHTSVCHTQKIIWGKCPASLPVTKISSTKRSESTKKKLWLVLCLKCPQISQRSSNIQKFTQSKEWNVSQESKSSLLVLYRIWERKAVTDSISQQRTFSLPSCWRQPGQTATDLFQWLWAFYSMCVYGFFVRWFHWLLKSYFGSHWYHSNEVRSLKSPHPTEPPSRLEKSSAFKKLMQCSQIYFRNLIALHFCIKKTHKQTQNKAMKKAVKSSLSINSHNTVVDHVSLFWQKSIFLLF